MSDDPIFDFDAVQCIVHMSDVDDDCETCQAEVKAMQHFHNKIFKANETSEQQLGHMGFAIDVTSVLRMRLNTLITVLVGDNPKTGLKYEIQFQLNMQRALDNLAAQATRARLLQGIKHV